MATVSNEQFLFCCIDNSNGGTINWTSVAEMCNTTKGAAAMRYRRMKEKFGTISSGTTSSDGAATKTTAGKNGDDEGATPKKGRPKKTASGKASAKKRKMSEDDVEDAGDDEETPIKGEFEDDI